ncbi:MAG: hypothetical protein H7329_02880 [Opitutaceae bacterium]|nr:hypothetical protein [Cytophagales bacterium]
MRKFDLFLNLVFLILFTSCNSSNSSVTNAAKIEYKNIDSIIGHKFFKVTETDSGNILFQPCGAEIENYKINEDLIIHNWGQETDIIKEVYQSQENQTILIKGHNENSSLNESYKVKKEKDSYFRINNILFIDSNSIKDLKIVEEFCAEDQPSNEKKSIKFETINHIKGLNFSIDCKSPNYVYFLVGGQFVTSDLTFNTRLEKIDDSTFNIYYSGSFEDNLHNRNKELTDALKEVPIAKANHIEGKLELTWYGFVNNSQVKFLEQNPFTGQIETDPIILDKCDN